MQSKEEIEKAYWKGYIQKQNEAMEICKQCKYIKKVKELETREQKLIRRLEDKIVIINKLLNEMLTELKDGTKIINITGLSKKEIEETANKRNCLIVQKYCYEEILKILKD